MNRHITDEFLNTLLSNELKPLMEIVKTDPSLDMEMRGNCVMVYYRGGKILSINDLTLSPNKPLLEGISENYSNDRRFLQDTPIPSLDNILGYFAKAKNVVDNYEKYVMHKLGEKGIQQRVVCENNYSVNADQTDFFIADMEWATENENIECRPDLVAFHWGHMAHQRRNLTLYLIEVKQGCGAVKTGIDENNAPTPGLRKHYSDFIKLSSDTELINSLKEDMLIILQQKYRLGLIDGLDDLFRNRHTNQEYSLDDIRINSKIEFAFLLANYLKYSGFLRDELNCAELAHAKFFESCLTGYGLYKDFIVDTSTLREKRPELFKG